MNWNDEVALNEIAQRRSILKSYKNDLGDEEYVEQAAGIISQMSISKGITDDDIQKALDISRLRRVRVLVTRQDGVVYQKTVYKKLEEANDETAQAYTGQAQVELDLRAGTPVHFKWTGSHTHTAYETDKAEIIDFDEHRIRVKLTEPFHTHNASNYTYDAGTTFTIPRLGKEAWNLDTYVKPIVRPPVVMAPIIPVREARTITSTTEASIGDTIEITQGETVRKGIVTYIYTPREGVTYQSAAGRTAKLKVKFEDGSETYVIPSSSRNTVRILGDESAPTMTFDAQVTLLRSQGFHVTFPQVANNVPTGETEEYQIQVRVDRFGNENRRGQSTATRTRTRTIFRQATPEERANADATGIAIVKPRYGNFNLVEFTTEFKAAFEQSGLGTFNPSELKMRWSSADNLEMRYHAGNLEMTRTFSMNAGVFQVYHAYFKVASHIRNKGAMKAIFKTLYKQYKNIGIEQLRVSANIDVGGYTWAKTGFRAEHSEAISQMNRMRSLVGQNFSIGVDKVTRRPMNYTITTADADEATRRVTAFYRANDNSARFPMRLLAGISDGKAGKALLLGQHWGGAVDLRKPDQRSDFENYINNVETP